MQFPLVTEKTSVASRWDTLIRWWNDHNSGVRAWDTLKATNATITTLTATGITDSWTAYTPTHTGFSVNPTMTGSYKLIGKTCFVNAFATLAGTSNATTFTITLPFPSSGAQQDGFGTSFDNGARQTSPAKLITRASSNIADVYKDFGLTGWTNSGTKYLEDFFITYQTT